MGFIFRPLNRADDEIRLIWIEPLNEQNPNDLVRCQLKYHSLKDVYFSDRWKDYLANLGRPQQSEDRLEWRKTVKGADSGRYLWGDFFALSYTWGPPGDSRDIIIDGDVVPVRKNLELALRAIRNGSHLGPRYHLWIDALCINQDDLKERGTEVGRMSYIYAHAIDTFVWLGGDGEIESILNALRFCKQVEGCWDDPSSLTNTFSDCLKTASTSLYLDLVNLTKLTYWKRQWVLQELAAGTEEMPVLYHDTRTNWSPMWRLIWYLRAPRHGPIGEACTAVFERFPAHKTELERTLGNEFFVTFENLSWTQWVLRGSETAETTDIFTYTRPSGATDARDKIYGLLGLINKNLASRVQPDYTAEPKEIYHAFAKDWIEAEDLEVFGQCDLNNTPSWVPRFDVNRPWYRHLSAAVEPAYRAHGGRHKKANVLHDKLLSEAILIDKVDGLSSANLAVEFNNENILQPSRSKLRFDSRFTKNAYGSLEALKEAIWRSMGGNRDLAGEKPAPPGYGMLLSPFSMENEPFNTWLQANGDFQVAGCSFIDYFRSDESSHREHHDADAVEAVASKRQDSANAVERFFRFGWSRRLMTTEAGFIGFVSETTEPGDWIVVFPGCSHPMAMRKVQKGAADQEPEFRIVSPCYLHGVMEGEIWEDVNNGKICTQRITIV